MSSAWDFEEKKFYGFFPIPEKILVNVLPIRIYVERGFFLIKMQVLK